MSEEQSTNKDQSHLPKKSWYERNYKRLLIIPALLVIFSFVYLFQFYSSNGDIVYKDVSLTGGTTFTVFDSEHTPSEIKSALISQFPDVNVRDISDIRNGKQLGLIVETGATAEEIEPVLENYLGYDLNEENSSVEFTGSSLSQGLYQQLRFAIILAFVFMGIIVFLIFRTPIRSLSIILAGFLDIIMTIVVLDILGIRLSMGGIVALLMLIGYSVDVDILLTYRVIKNKAVSLNQRIYGAFKTGITMTLTAIAASAVALIFTFRFSPTLSQMFTIILIGLCFDIFNCWITNASILKWYMEAKKIE